ncbi:RNA-binding motif protein 25 isoform X2 [Prosopis cineraria]|uniref:RNA-binding motif protein 25 isoform X2 n=1 Tax=Prosopis cineraria TaxID=364024 RepID=UPI00240FE24D|nr:RNA-binding motif protein 25 isoform X2 [Prosopis cineraria]XP_054823936.1 RNA-binding motif protein 25 isoform X2 [Prosopis cineraria]XP_054823937.1 RNA-binding motif protein 25 isoform X2 [Prosopis cineraria]XP_054823938.1 RNA-binding motif protein 25 isoform X2 [Prosopis cineraria]
MHVGLVSQGMPRFPHPYGTMVRPSFPPRPPGAVNVLPAVSRPPVAGIPPVRPVIPPVVRPVVAPNITPADKPQTTVYIGKIASTVENEFMLSLLQLCGPIKSWKRPQNPTNGTPLSFGFWEFDSAEGVLRALRLLNNLNVDGQELMVNPNDATKEYLEKYVKKKNENLQKDTQAVGSDKDDENAPPSNAKEDEKPDDSKKDDSKSGNKENHNATNLGIITDEDREADREALEKITNMIEERLKTRPLPPPPAQAAPDGAANSALEQPSKARDGDSDADTVNNEAGDDRNDKETNSENKATSEHDKPETPDRRHDRRSRERDRDRELKREKDRELERYEREAERERIRKEREQRRRIEEAERQYETCLKDWEYREREREKERQYEKEKEKERERKRRKEILYDEEDDDDDSRKRWRRSALDEKRKKRMREKEEDLADRQKEEEEIADAKRRAEEDQQLKQQRDALRLFSEHVNGGEKSMATEDMTNQAKNIVPQQDTVADHGYEGHIGDGNPLNGINDESTMASVAVSDARQSGNVPAKKLGFGLVGSGKRTTVPSVFHEDEEDDARKDKKMRPLVPIDYSTEELQAVQSTVSGAPPANLAAAAEFAKRLSNANIKEEKVDGDWDRIRRSSEKSNYRDRDRNDEDGSHNKDESREKISDRDRDRDRGLEKLKTSDNKKLLDAKQLIDMIPKTKDELFSYEINWAVYDKHHLHERMRPWISKKITEFLGEEETTLVDYIVSSTQEHVKASQMLELLQSILDEEAEMFVLKMWRMLIFEIKKVETGLALRSKS